MMPRMFGYIELIAIFCSSRISRCFRAMCMSTDAYHLGIHCTWCLSIDMSGILLHVDFEIGLSISVLKTGELFTNE